MIIDIYSNIPQIFLDGFIHKLSLRLETVGKIPGYYAGLLTCCQPVLRYIAP